MTISVDRGKLPQLGVKSRELQQWFSIRTVKWGSECPKPNPKFQKCWIKIVGAHWSPDSLSNFVIYGNPKEFLEFFLSEATRGLVFPKKGFLSVLSQWVRILELCSVMAKRAQAARMLQEIGPLEVIPFLLKQGLGKCSNKAAFFPFWRDSCKLPWTWVGGWIPWLAFNMVVLL